MKEKVMVGHYMYEPSRGGMGPHIFVRCGDKYMYKGYKHCT